MSKSKIEKRFWDDSWNRLPFEKYYGIEKYLAVSRKLNGLFKRILVRGNSQKILEIGCARAKQLIYFAKEFGYNITGIDLSEKGVAVAKANLSIAKVQGEILCEDIFSTTLKEGSFDIVYSMGLVEHFEAIEGIVDAHIKMLKHGGTMIITVPNFRNSLYLWLSGVFGHREWILKNHNLETMNKDIWLRMVEKKNMKVLFVDYYGTVDVMLGVGIVKQKAILYPLLLVNQVIGYLTYFMGSSRYFSPYLVVIARAN